MYILILLALFFLTAPTHAATNNHEDLRNTLRSIHTRYNRVEGFFAGYQLKVSPPQWNGLYVLAETGYGIQSEKMRWITGLGYTQKKYGLQLIVFDRTASNDEQIIHTAENSFFAFLFKGDYRDYYRAKYGFEFQTTYHIQPRLHLWGSLTAYSYESMPIATQWSLLRSGHAFRANPLITPGKLGLLQVGMRYDTRRRAPHFLNAWYISATLERGFREFAYNGLNISLTRHQKTIWGNQAFIVQTRLATRSHNAEQFLFDLGGVGTLRGYDIKEFTGNRMMMASIDYLFRGDLLSHIPLPMTNLFNLVLFADTAWAYQMPKSDNFLNGFQNLSLNDFKTNVGIAIGITERLFRLNLARRLDRSNDAWTVSARFFREF